jgi:hypothetical protein
LNTKILKRKFFKKDDNISWKIRYAAIKGLVNICNSLNDKDNEELRKTCWACLVVCQENETNPNVLEAIKVGQVNYLLFKYKLNILKI